jgi:hypothetical protein
MRRLGFALIASGFLVGSLAAVFKESAVRWSLYVPALLVGLAGVAAARREPGGSDAGDEVAAGRGERALRAILERVATRLDDLIGRREAIDVYDMRHEIDALFLEDLDAFARDRQIIARRFGLQSYADVMSHFAAGERYLNRTWCASADGYIDEVGSALQRAAEEFAAALERFPHRRSVGP